FVGGILVQLPGALKVGMRYNLQFDLFNPDLKKFVLLSLPFIIGMSMTFSNEFLFRFFGLMLDRGSLAGLNYAFRLMMIVVGVFGQAFAQAAYPFMSHLAAENKIAEMNRLAARVIKNTSSLAIPFSAVICVLSAEIIGILFERGEFTAAATGTTAPALSYYITGAFAIAGTTVVIRCFFAMQNTLFPMIVSTGAVAGFLPLYWVAIGPLGLDYLGIPVVAALSMIFQFFLLYFLWSRWSNDTQGFRQSPAYIIKVIITASVSAGICLGIRAVFLPIVDHFPQLISSSLTLIVSGTPALLFSFIIMQVTGIQDMRELYITLMHKSRLRS
ncbi:MAG: hypothetical protein GF350_04430, partial [Chitinivibrionales bacterium]|nr:hypothetical protein [Chitinivibrionales bacterium]